MLPARFTRTFILVIVGLVVLTSLLMFHEPTRKTYFDAYTGHLFDSDGVQGDYAQARPPIRPPVRPPVRPSSVLIPEKEVPEEASKELQGIHGSVIMSKLGNETAKYVCFNYCCIEFY